MKYPALASTFAGTVWILGAGAAAACIPPLSHSAAEQAEADLSTQASAWAGASSVYIGRIAEIRVRDAATGNILPGPQISSSHEVVLIAEALLKGPFPRGAKTLTFIVSPWCVPSDIERGRVGDRFVVYAGAEGASAQSGMIALGKIRHPETLAAVRIASSMASGPGDTEMPTVNGTGIVAPRIGGGRLSTDPAAHHP